MIQAFILPMYHGTSEGSALKISKNGFGTVSTLDEGYFGRGIYFTSSMQYARKYGQVLLLTLVIPGNPFPVTEHPFQLTEDGKIKFATSPDPKMPAKYLSNPIGFYGKSLNPGYQSNYALVEGDNTSSAFPISSPERVWSFSNEEEGESTPLVADELVIPNESQALPLFLIYPSEFQEEANANEEDFKDSFLENPSSEGCFLFQANENKQQQKQTNKQTNKQTYKQTKTPEKRT